MAKTRVLWISDAVAATGFARVSHSVLNHLVQDEDFDFHMLGINYFGDPHGYDYPIYPASSYGSHVLGFNRLPNLVEYLNPDVVFILNDIWVIDQYLGYLPDDIRIITYSPIDAGPLNRRWLKNLYERVSGMAVYTAFAHEIITTQFPLLSPAIIPHGIDFESFHPVENARDELDNLEDDMWIVLNANRNQPRKKIDSTIRGFAEFAKDKPENVKLYLHMAINDMGWDIQDIWERLDLEERIIITNPTIGPQNPVSDETLNYIYNACDVGLNTSLGEGWGLPNFEHAATKRLQIVPDSSACAEIFGNNRGLLIDVFDQPLTHINGVNTNGMLVKETSVAERLQWAYDHPEECQIIADRMYEYLQSPRFEWANIAKQFAKLLRTSRVLATNK